MSRRFWIGVFLWASAVVMAAFPARSNGQEEMRSLKQQELTAIKTSVGKAAAVSVSVVTIEVTGSFENVGQEMKNFQEEWQRQKPLPAGSKFKPTGILVLLEDPTNKTSFKMQVGSTAPANIKVKEPLVAHKIEFPAAASHKHQGDYKELADVYHAMNAVKPVDFPVVMKLLSAPGAEAGKAATAPRTELIVPLKR